MLAAPNNVPSYLMPKLLHTSPEVHTPLLWLFWMMLKQTLDVDCDAQVILVPFGALSGMMILFTSHVENACMSLNAWLLWSTKQNCAWKCPSQRLLPVKMLTLFCPNTPPFPTSCTS